MGETALKVLFAPPTRAPPRSQVKRGDRASAIALGLEDLDEG
jgi:hypothetical protein